MILVCFLIRKTNTYKPRTLGKRRKNLKITNQKLTHKTQTE